MTTAALQRLLALMRRLRDPVSGCSWDRAQDARSLARYTLEEAYELVDAIEQGDLPALRDELGDLLFQVVFHSQLLEEQGVAAFDDVAAAIADKLERRHPHVFAVQSSGLPAESVPASWERLKAGERQARGLVGQLDDVPLALPALSRAAKLGRRAAQVGFDWPDAQGALAKVREEADEVAAEFERHDPARLEEEIGDLLLAVTSLARHVQVDPETALRRANGKFEARFAHMERLAAGRGQKLQELTPEQADKLWQDAKRDVQS